MDGTSVSLSWKRILRFGLSVTALLILLPLASSFKQNVLAQGPGAASVVGTWLSVTDKAGTPVTSLTTGDLKLFEDGKAQTITAIRPASHVPLSIGLLVDNSGSTVDSRPQMQAALNSSMQLFRATLKTGSDKVALFTFGNPYSVDLDFTDDIPQLVSALNTTLGQPYGGTALYEALVHAATLLSQRPGRRLIVVVSDGDDTQSRKSISEAMQSLRQHGIVVIGIFTPGTRMVPSADRGRDVLEAFVAETGGWYYDSRDLKRFQNLADELNSQYWLEYSPTNQNINGKYRKIRIESTKKDLKLKHRPGYYPGM